MLYFERMLAREKYKDFKKQANQHLLWKSCKKKRE